MLSFVIALFVATIIIIVCRFCWKFSRWECTLCSFFCVPLLLLVAFYIGNVIDGEPIDTVDYSVKRDGKVVYINKDDNIMNLSNISFKNITVDDEVKEITVRRVIYDNNIFLKIDTYDLVYPANYVRKC